MQGYKSGGGSKRALVANQVVSAIHPDAGYDENKTGILEAG
jgi:hypothetical protein